MASASLINNGYVKIDNDIIKEIFEYLIKTKLPKIGRFDVGEIHYDKKEKAWMSQVFYEHLYEHNVPFHFKLPRGKDSRAVGPLLLDIESRSKISNEDAFRRSRYMGKKIEEIMAVSEEMMVYPGDPVVLTGPVKRITKPKKKRY